MKQLRQFIVVAQELNFSRAAERLCISQPPLSVSIRKLEEHVGTPLFIRERPQLRLTAAGEHFLKHAIQMVAQYDAAIKSARSISVGAEGILRISFLPSAAFNVLPAIIRRFKTAHSKVRIIPSSNNSEHIFTAVRNGDVDIGLAVRFGSTDNDLSFITAGYEKIMLAVPEHHRLISDSKVNVHDLKNEALISFPLHKDFGFGNRILAMCRHYGFYPDVIMEAAQMQTILTLVASGIGIAFVPSTSMSIQAAGVQFLELFDPEDRLRYELSFLYKTDNDNQIIHTFIQEARSHIPQLCT